MVSPILGMDHKKIYFFFEIVSCLFQFRLGEEKCPIVIVFNRNRDLQEVTPHRGKKSGEQNAPPPPIDFLLEGSW